MSFYNLDHLTLEELRDNLNVKQEYSLYAYEDNGEEIEIEDYQYLKFHDDLIMFSTDDSPTNNLFTSFGKLAFTGPKYEISVGRGSSTPTSYSGYVDDTGHVTLTANSDGPLIVTCYNRVFRISLKTEYGEAVYLLNSIMNWVDEIHVLVEESKQPSAAKDSRLIEEVKTNPKFGNDWIYTASQYSLIAAIVKKYGFILSEYDSISYWRCPKEIEEGRINYRARIQYLLDRIVNKKVKKDYLDGAIYYKKAKLRMPLWPVFGTLAFLSVALYIASGILYGYPGVLGCQIAAVICTILVIPMTFVAFLFLILSIAQTVHRKDGLYIENIKVKK